MKDYDANPAEVPTREFTLRGQVFTAKGRMPGDAFDDLAETQAGNPPTPRLYELFVGIIRRTLVAESREAWDKLMSSDLDVPIEITMLATIADDLVAQEAGRPPQPLTPSTPSRVSGGTPSTENSDSPAEPASTVST